MFNDYKEAVFANYKRKREEGMLSLNLTKPRPGSMRTECLHVYAEAYSNKDDHALRLFFGPKGYAEDYSQVIRKFDIDKFRPLVNFLKGKTADTEEKNIELLAWLIGFEPRPYKFGTTYHQEIVNDTNHTEYLDLKKKSVVDDRKIPSVEPSETTRSNQVTKNEPDEQTGERLETKTTNENVYRPSVEEKQWNDTKTLSKQWLITHAKKVLFYSIAAIGIATGTYLFSRNSNPGCMYWADDHYRPVSCREKVDNKLIIALDTFKAAHLRKIIRPDTITENALEKVWYAKITMDSIEFYTSGGTHPVFPMKKLKPLTGYIWGKYVRDRRRHLTPAR